MHARGNPSDAYCRRVHRPFLDGVSFTPYFATYGRNSVYLYVTLK
jgi:hypothetical protein